MGFGAVNETAPEHFFCFRSRKIAKKAGVLFVSLSSVKTSYLRKKQQKVAGIYHYVFATESKKGAMKRVF